MKKCKYCAEEIQDEASLCPHCRKSLVERKGKKKLLWGLIGIFIISPVSFAILGPFAIFLWFIFGWILWAGVFEFFGWGNFFFAKS